LTCGHMDWIANTRYCCSIVLNQLFAKFAASTRWMLA
jgi:hypothetical protein